MLEEMTGLRKPFAPNTEKSFFWNVSTAWLMSEAKQILPNGPEDQLERFPHFRNLTLAE